MKYIIFLILIILITILYLYSDKKVSNFRNQVLALKQQNSSLRSTISKLDIKETTDKNIVIIPCELQYTSGIILKSSKVYIGPLNNLPIIYTTEVNMEVKIYDKVQSNGQFWYYAELPNDSEVNSRGWIKEGNFTTFGNSFSNIVKRF